MVASVIAVLLVVMIGLALPLALYRFVRAEHDKRETMTRDDAERAARRDTHEKR
ncbi:hypothetical protein [Halorhabdus rudnickae]|uniref:hypothetical protein n=1 Tax=Halorhabdus rudnickae TaxID=1775544 RepID=UPI0014384CC0|nr:hypothetical protein [Halorhabdus rudnickae]